MKILQKRIKASGREIEIRSIGRYFLNEIFGSLTKNVISMVLYKPTHFTHFKPTNEFGKWAAVKVKDFDNVPMEMETFVLPSGLYAVFEYKGINTDDSIFQYILGTWLPSAEYVSDHRLTRSFKSSPHPYPCFFAV